MSSGEHDPLGAIRPAPRLLRAALRCWPRADRVASGEVVIDTARDLIDQGGSLRAEAAGLVRSGLGLRVRRTRRDLGAAPWAQATRLAIISLALLALSLIAASWGGPAGITDGLLRGMGIEHATGPDGGPMPGSLADLALPLAALLVLAVAGFATGRRLMAAALAACGAGAVLAAMCTRGYGYVWGTIDYQLAADRPPDYEPSHHLFSSIDLTGVVAWLLFAGAVASVAWAITQRRLVPAAGRSAEGRRTVVRWTGLAGLVVVALWGAPLLAGIVDLAIRRALPADQGAESTAAASAMLILAGTIVGAWVFSFALRRRSPGAAHAAALMGAVLWVPGLWIGLGLGQTAGLSPPLAGVLGESLAVALFWPVGGAIGLVLVSRVIASAGRAARPGSPVVAAEHARD